MYKNLYIIGAGGFGREVADTVCAINRKEKIYDLKGFVDDAETLQGTVINGVSVVGTISTLKELALKERVYAVVAIADTKARENIVNQLPSEVVWETLIHPSATVSEYSVYGRGCVIQANAIICPNTHIGNHCIINATSGMGHDSSIDDYVSIMSFCDITGYVTVGRSTFMGTSVSIVPSTKIGEHAYLCAGSVVMKDVEKFSTVLGNPAKRIK